MRLTDGHSELMPQIVAAYVVIKSGLVKRAAQDLAREFSFASLLAKLTRRSADGRCGPEAR